ncbi:MAG TPA: transposase [Candidatus Dormibacteraeota bacterium]|nr:transposase [Candidatus Dormibacteraeota bacterium]
MTTLDDLERWGEAFLAFHARFADRFARRESREQVAKYLRGLLAPVEGKNSWQVAEAIGSTGMSMPSRTASRPSGAGPSVTRKGLVSWTRPASQGTPRWGAPEKGGGLGGGAGVGLGHGRQGRELPDRGLPGGPRWGPLTDATSRGHVFLDRRRYLPEAWCNDPVRRARTKVPEEVGFQTKPEHAWGQGVPMRWGSGDEIDGDAPRRRETIERHGRGYVLAVS